MRLRLLGPCLLIAACGSDAGDGDADDGADTDDPAGWNTGGGDTDGDDPTDPVPNPYTDGGAETCVLLFGGNDRVRGPDEGFPLWDSARTLQAWIRTDHTGEQIAVSYGRPSPSQGFLLGTVDGYPLVRAGSGDERIVGTTFVADDEWHHLAASFNGTVVALTVDGEVDAVGPLTAETLEGDLVAGNTPTGDLTNPWIGWLDDIRLFDRNRDVEDIAADLDGEEAAPATLLLAWDFEIQPDSTGPGLTVPDDSGNGHHGITGGAEGRPLFLPCR